MPWSNIGGADTFVKDHINREVCPNYSPENSEFIMVETDHYICRPFIDHQDSLCSYYLKQ